MSDYAEKLKDPRWQKKRLDILKRDNWNCQLCWEKTKTLNVHHKYYLIDCDPWDYPDEALITLCVECHEGEKEEIKVSLRSLCQTLKQKGFMASEICDIAIAFSALEIKKYNEFSMFLIYFFQEKETLKKQYNKFKIDKEKHS